MSITKQLRVIHTTCTPHHMKHPQAWCKQFYEVVALKANIKVNNDLHLTLTDRNMPSNNQTFGGGRNATQASREGITINEKANSYVYVHHETTKGHPYSMHSTSHEAPPSMV
jgi:hypothetical protein